MAKTKKGSESSPSKESKKEVKKDVQIRASSRRRVVDTEEWVSRHVSELVPLLGLDFLRLSTEEYLTVLIRIVDLVRGESVTLDVETIVKRIRRNSDRVYPLLRDFATRIKEFPG